MPKFKIFFCLSLSVFFISLPPAFAQEDAEPDLQIEIRQSQFHDNFNQRELRVYRLIDRQLTLVVEKFNDPEAELSLDHLLDEAAVERLKNVISRNRVMDTEIGCEMISRSTRTKLKTEIRIAYQGGEVTCYSFDQPFARPFEEVLKAINRIMPVEQYRLAIPSTNPRIEVGQ